LFSGADRAREADLTHLKRNGTKERKKRINQQKQTKQKHTGKKKREVVIRVKKKKKI